MQDLGNDFIVLVNVMPSIEKIRILADRHYGIGADQVLCLSFSENSEKRTSSVTFFNADGSQAEICGNGLRCAGLLLQRLTKKQTHTLRTSTRSYIVEVLDKTVRAHMGTVTLLPSIEALFAQASVKDMRPFVRDYGLVDVGNPHLVFFLNTPDASAMAMRFGSFFETLTLFPKRINVGFARVDDAQSSSLTFAVWERGSGLTLACGSGAMAAAALAHHLYGLSWPVCVSQKGGPLFIDMKNGEYTQTGPAHFVFEGDIPL
jgi:diaminopimelate epimerase